MPRKLYLLAACLLALALSQLTAPDLTGHGLRAVYSPSGVDRLERVVLLTSNDGSVHPDSPLTIKWRGYLYLPAPAEVYFRIPSGVRARLTLNDDPVFDTVAKPGPAAASGAYAVAYPIAGFNTVTFEIDRLTEWRPYFQAGLEWQTPLGWQLVPAAYLYPEPVAEALAQEALQRAAWSRGLAGLSFLFALALAGSWLWGSRHRLVSRPILGLALIAGLAFTLRLGFLRDYAAQPTADVLGYGSDQRGYEGAALEYLRGHWPPPQPFYVQPGISLLLGAAYSRIGPNIRAIQIFQMALGALTCFLIFDLARHTFDAATGWLAALLWAIFPLPIFYEAQLLTHGLEPILGAFLLFLWVRSLASAQNAGAWIAALGVGLGVASIFRPTFLSLAPFAALTLFFKYRPHWRRMIGWPALLALAALLPILPITWHNYQTGGRFQLLTSNSDVTLYLGNNRDSTGLGEYSPAYQATHTLVNQGKTTFLGQTLADIRADPVRWLQLMIRKTALYVGDPELPNNVDFYREGTDISPLLAALPLRFGTLITLATAGAALAWLLRDRATDASPFIRVLGPTPLLLYAGLQIAVTVVYHVFSRFRAPIYPTLSILGAYAITATFSAFVRDQPWRQRVTAVVAVLAASVFISAMPTLAESIMSRPVVSALPPTARPLNAAFDDSLTLVGYEPLPVAAPGDPFFITLYWQSHNPILIDLYTTVQLSGGERKVTQADQPIGTGSFPDYPTRQWQPGQIVRDTVFLRMPDDVPTPLSLTLLIAPYDRASGDRVGETTLGYLPLTKKDLPSIPAEAQTVNATIGTALLNAYTIQGRTLTLYWQAGDPMPQDGIVFIHLFDPAGNFVGGGDSRPRDGLYSTPAWQKGEGVTDVHTLPDAPPGDYTLKVGMYDAATQTRLPVVNWNGERLPDGILSLGIVALK